jgi:hypothetical protein
MARPRKTTDCRCDYKDHDHDRDSPVLHAADSARFCAPHSNGKISSRQPCFLRLACNPLVKQITPVSLVALIVTFAAQIAWAGGHSSGRTVHVHSYYRKDGTYVHAYDRAAPGTASHSAATSGTGTTKSSAAYVPTTSSTSASNAAITAAVAVPAATPDLRSSSGDPICDRCSHFIRSASFLLLASERYVSLTRSGTCSG